MKSKLFTLVVATLLSLQIAPTFAAITNVYSTQFEAAQGYNINSNLVGQAGWISEGTGGNGITNTILGQGQSAYIGRFAPNPANDNLVIWKPINFNAVAAGYPIVKFSTLVQLRNSANSEYDFFQWRLYNSQGNRLFILDFDIYNTNINYRLDGTNGYVDTGWIFSFNTTYTLGITMNFASNRWSATLNNTILATNLPITTTNAPLNFGDMDAVWSLYDTNAPGDNYMIFDNYTITAETIPVPPAQVQFLGRTGDGWSLLRVAGQNGSRWSLDATTNLVNWIALKTNVISGTSFDHVDTTSAGLPRRFYRARLVP